MNVQDRLNQLFAKYLNGTCSPAEWEELQILVTGIKKDDTETLTEPLLRLWEQARNKALPSTTHQLDKAKIYAAIVNDQASSPPLIHRIGRRQIAAAAVLLILITSTILYLTRRQNSSETAPAAAFALIKPGFDKAVLTLSNGQQVVLDSTHSDTTVKQGNTTIVNANGQLAYKIGKDPAREGKDATPDIIYNTVATGRANQYRLVLPDGTKVWLNAISSIRFPAAFNSTERTVTITGEAYFEVAKNSSQPFHVKVGAADITVLGTEFNVNAYTDEPVIMTSLLEGALKVSGPGITPTPANTGATRSKTQSGNTPARSGLLAPGQEASLNPDGHLSIAYGNVDAAAAWKNGFFQFDKSPLPDVMRQIGRWYDLDIRYQGGIPDRLFKGKVQRGLPLSGILRLLQAEDIHCRLEDRTLIILPD